MVGRSHPGQFLDLGMDLDLIIGQRQRLLDDGVLYRRGKIRPLQNCGRTDALKCGFSIGAVSKDTDDHGPTATDTEDG